MVNRNEFDFSQLGGIPEFTEREEFFSFADQFGATPQKRKRFERQFEQIQDLFGGELAKRGREGGSLNLQFSDFVQSQFSPGLEGISPSERRHLGKSPTQRGDFSQFLNPRTRFLVNF